MIACVHFIDNFCTMLFIPAFSLPKHKRKLETTSSLAQIFLLILSISVNSNEAAVIKKRDAATSSGYTDLELKELQVLPTILTKLNNTNSMITTKLQPMFVSNFTGETSREVANNEILFNEAKKLPADEEKNNKHFGIGAAAESLETNLKSPDVSQQDFKQIKENLESEAVTPQVTTEFSSNDIKEEEKIPKLVKQHVMSSSQDKVDFKDYENAGSLENSLKVYDSNPRPPSKILTELRSVTVTETETEKPLNKAQDQNKQLENSIDSDKDNIKTKFEKEAKHNKEQVPIKPLPATEQLDLLETSTLRTRVTTLHPLKDLDTKNEIKFLDSLTEVQTKDQQANKISKHLEKTLFTSSPSLLSHEANKLATLTKEGNKTNHARAIVFAETTSAANIELTEATTFEPAIEVTTLANQATTNLTILNVKGKKPKFINDNSTNAQQLNLPNNAEVWSLAAMKSLPTKLNLTNINTEPEHTTNQTDKENTTHTNASASNLSLNNNSEKNLLDWSQIMMDKELSTTTRNKDDKILQEMEIATDKQQNQQIIVDTTTGKTADTSTESSEIMEHYELSTTTVMPFIAPPSTILSILNASEADKKTEENIKDKFTTTVATNVANNPFNTSLNIEPNLNEINLTLNQTQHVLNNNTTTAAEKSVDDDDVTYTVTTENSVAAMMTTKTTKLATTEATAVVEMTTVEQISSESTTVSAYETTKQYASLSNSDVIINQPELNIKNNKNENQNDNGINNESNSSAIEISQNELENVNVVVKPNEQNEIIDTNIITTTTATATVIPITTFRPSTSLAIPTSTTSLPKTYKQEVDQNSNEIQKNLTNSQQQQQSISKTATDLNDNQLTKSNETHLVEREYETTTTATTTTTTELKSHNIENNTLMTTAATSYSKDEQINETTEINLDLRETATTITEAVSTTIAAAVETTPKPVNEQESTRVQVETTTGSSVSTDKKLEKENKTSEINFSKNTFYTSTETPVVTDFEGDKASTTTTTITITPPPLKTTGTTEQTIIENTTLKQENDIKENILTEEDAKTDTPTTTTTTTTKTVMNNTTETTTITTPVTVTKEEETYKNLLDDTTTTTTTTAIPPTYTSTISTTDTSPKPTTTPTTSTLATTTISPPPSSTSTLPSAIPTKVQEIYNVINSTTTELIQTTTQQLLTEIETESSTDPTVFSSTTTTGAYFEEMLPTAPTTHSTPMIDTANIGKSLPTLTSIMGGNSGNMYPKNSDNGETDVNVIIAITVSVIGVVALILLVGFLYLMRKRQKQTSYSQRCRPVLEDYTIDNLSVGGSMRKSCTLRASKRTYGNLAFDDPALRPNSLGVHELAKFAQEKLRIFEEFREVPQITSRLDEVPIGCEDKNRYANVLPLPETRVILQRLNDDEKSEYINANYVTGPKDAPNYYIACQAPLESTVEDFWRMIWEQQSRVIIQATDLIENGVEKCAEYLPPSATLDNHSSFGDFQITLQNREVKDKYAISTILLKHVSENTTRELTHYWYKWPEVGVPSEEAPIIAMLLEARSSLISYAIEQANEDKEKSLKSAEEGLATPNDSLALPTNNTSNSSSANGSSGEINGNISMVHIKKTVRNQGPLTIHCSPGTGRTGTIIACDIAIRSLETPKRTVDIPQIVYYVRRGRASAIRTKDQYEFIYKVANMYAAKITNPTNYN